MRDVQLKTLVSQINGDAREIVIAILLVGFGLAAAMVFREEIRTFFGLIGG